MILLVVRWFAREVAHDRADKARLTCSHCKCKGNEVFTCFQLHGKPNWWEKKYGCGAKNGSKGASVGATLPSSSAGGAPSPAGVEVTPHVVFPDNSSSIPAAGGASLVDLSPTQLQAFVQLINTETSKGDRMMGTYISNNWIIDMGASHHVTCDLMSLSDVTTIGDCLVGLPDGSSAVATMESRVTRTQGLTLHHVLYVPRINCNLILVSQMIDESNCHIKFTSSLCVYRTDARGP